MRNAKFCDIIFLTSYFLYNTFFCQFDAFPLFYAHPLPSPIRIDWNSRHFYADHLGVCVRDKLENSKTRTPKISLIFSVSSKNGLDAFRNFSSKQYLSQKYPISQNCVHIHVSSYLCAPRPKAHLNSNAHTRTHVSGSFVVICIQSENFRHARENMIYAIYCAKFNIEFIIVNGRKGTHIDLAHEDRRGWISLSVKVARGSLFA